MPLFETRDKLEYKRAIQKWNNSSRLFTLNSNNGIIEKEFDEDAHPRDEHGRFSSGGGGGGGSSESESGGITEPLVNGPKETNAFIDSYFAEHPEVAEDAKNYTNVLSNVQNFRANNPNAAEATYNAVTGEKIDSKDLKGYCVTFHQNLSLEDPYGAYTPENYAAMCAIAKNELNAKSVNIGNFGNPEVSFTCNNYEKAMQFAIEHNQHSIFNPEKGEIKRNDYYNPATNPIKDHE